MNAPLRQGWCPGALRPMAVKDGLLVRLRLTSGILPAATARALAELAARYGNGLFDLSARANLQMRGVSEDALPALQDGLSALGLLDVSVDAESVRNVIASPLSGLREGLDIRPLVIALEQRLLEDAALHALPGKFGFLVDDGGCPTLADVEADVRFHWTGQAFAIGLGGTRSDAVWIGVCDPDDVAGRAAQIARVFLALTQKSRDVRRMRHLVRALGAEALTETCGRDGESPHASADAEATPDQVRGRLFSRNRETEVPRLIVGQRTFNGSPCLGLAAPFGRLDVAMLLAAADVAATTSFGELRLTPWRVILIPGAESVPALTGFITDLADSRLAVAACVGANGCARGTTDTRADAAALAAALPRGDGIALHVSGCEKGCAKPSATPLTLVAHDGRYDLIFDGRAGDQPKQRGLDLAAASSALALEAV